MASSSQPLPPPAPAIPTIPSQPSDIELVMMLAAFVDPSASPPGNITIHDADADADADAQDPDDLTRQFAASVAKDRRKVWYFFTMLQPKSRRGKRKKRDTPSGMWRGEGKSKSIVGSEGREVGHLNLLSFINKVDGANRTGWIMHEFRLPGDQESPVVLCKVFRSSRWCTPNPALSAMSEAHAQAQAEVEVEEDEVLVEPVEAMEQEGALAASLAAVEALMMRDDEANIQERQNNLTAREARAAPERKGALATRLAALEAALEALVRRDEANLMQESHSNLTARALRAALMVLEQVGDGLGRRDETNLHEWQDLNWTACRWRAALMALEKEEEWLARREREVTRLAASERDLQQRERNVTVREAASAAPASNILQTIYQEFEALLHELVLLMATVMMTAALVARAGLLLAIAGGSKAAIIVHCGGALELASVLRLTILLEGGRLELPRSWKYCIKVNSVEI